MSCAKWYAWDVRAYATAYRAEDIINWRVKRVSLLREKESPTEVGLDGN